MPVVLSKLRIQSGLWIRTVFVFSKKSLPDRKGGRYRGGGTHVMYGHSRMAINPRIHTIPGRGADFDVFIA